MDKSIIQALMKQFIAVKAKEIMGAKPEGKQYMELADMEELTAHIEGLWAEKCGEVPIEISAVSKMACASLDPDKERRTKLIRDAISATSGIGGVMAILTAIGTALGWGASVWTTIAIAVGGVSLAGPLALAAAGALAVTLAGYLVFNNSSKEEASDKALKIYREGITGVITNSMWDKYKDKWSD